MPFCIEWLEFESTRQYECIDPDDPDGVLWAVGCVLCIDEPPRAGSRSNGRRFLIPSEFQESRSAEGTYPYLGTFAPRRMLPSTVHGVAQCHTDKIECHFLDNCDCGDDDWCPDPWPVDCTEIKDMVPTCVVFTGYGWPPSFPNMICSGVDTGQDVPIWIRLIGGRHGQNTMTQDRSCTANMFAACCGQHRVIEPCEFTPNANYYNDPSKTRFDFIRINQMSARVVVPDFTAPKIEGRAEVRALNTVLQFVEDDIIAAENGMLHFDQLDSPRRFASPGENMNPNLDQYNRFWNWPFPQIEFGQLPTMIQFMNCYLENNPTVQVIVEYVLVQATFELSLVHHVVNQTQPVCSDEFLPTDFFPLVRGHLHVMIGSRAFFATGNNPVIERTWLPEPDTIELEIQQGVYGSRTAKIKDDLDRIVIVDDEGIQFQPRWRGYIPFHLGWLTDPSSIPAQIPEGTPSPLHLFCEEVALMWDNTFVGVRNSHPQNTEGNVNQLLTGGLNIQRFTDPVAP